MKRFFIPIVFGIWVMLAGVTAIHSQVESPTPFTITDEELAKLSDEDMAKTEAHRQQLLRDAEESAGKVADVASDAQLGATNKGIQADLSKAVKDFKDYKDASEIQIAQGNKSIIALAHVMPRYHRLKWIACALVVAVAAFVALKVPAFGVYIGGGVAVAGIAAVWAFL
jgi:hypothetical protein